MKKVIYLFVLFSLTFLLSCDMNSKTKTPELITLDTPVVTISATGLASWAEVDNAVDYGYKINGSLLKYTSELSIQLNDGDSFTVKAIGDGITFEDSRYSKVQIYEKGNETSLPTEEDKTTNSSEHMCSFPGIMSYDEKNHWRECSCGEKIDIEQHNWNEGKVIQEPTESLLGVKLYSCINCSQTKEEFIDMIEHSHTHNLKSNESYHWYECVCGDKIYEAPHTWDAGQMPIIPTEDKEGLKVFTCLDCQRTKEEILEKLEHSHYFNDMLYSDEYYHWYQCICGVKNDISNHNFGKVLTLIEPTEETTGLELHNCYVCGIEKEVVIPELGHVHNFNVINYNETEHFSECRCGERIEIQEHILDEGQVVYEQSCTSEGAILYSCNICTYSYNESLEKLPHSYSGDWVKDENNHWYECECGDKKELSGHEFIIEEISAPTCIEDGLDKYTCSECLYEKEVVGDASGHYYSDRMNSDEEYHWYECGCGVKENYSTHEFDDGTITKEPTREETGIKTYTCLSCGRIKEEIIPTLEHTHSYSATLGFDISNHWHECECGHQININKHVYNDGVVKQEPTSGSTGIRVYSCTRCMYEKEVIIYDLSNQEVVSLDSDNINIGGVCYNDLSLNIFGVNGSKISWQSSDQNLISNDGKVQLPSIYEGRKTVTLTATISYGEGENKISTTKDIDVTLIAEATVNELIEVKETEESVIIRGYITAINKVNSSGVCSFILTDYEGNSIFCYDGLSSISLGDEVVIECIYSSYNSHSQIANSILLEAKPSGKNISEISGNISEFDAANIISLLSTTNINDETIIDIFAQKYIKITGYLCDVSASYATIGDSLEKNSKNIRVYYSEDLELSLAKNLNQKVELYCFFRETKINNGNIIFQLQNITGLEITDYDYVTFDSKLIHLPSTLYEQLTLPTVGTYGSNISWSSSNEEYITSEGKVTKPSEEVGEVEVTLTATITKGNAEIVLEFTYQIKPSSNIFDKAIFEFGEDKVDAGHYDGKEMTKAKEFENNGYVLTFDSYSKVWYDANDATGKSTLKLGTGSTNGAITFTVSPDVNEVVIYIAKYKTNATNVTVNGVNYTINTSSNDGQYTEIIVDTSESKTVEIAVNKRAMIDKIIFK